jgi:hypothetical protein
MSSYHVVWWINSSVEVGMENSRSLECRISSRPSILSDRLKGLEGK